jgi:hypothetical protein
VTEPVITIIHPPPSMQVESTYTLSGTGDRITLKWHQVCAKGEKRNFGHVLHTYNDAQWNPQEKRQGKRYACQGSGFAFLPRNTTLALYRRGAV